MRRAPPSTASRLQTPPDPQPHSDPRLIPVLVAIGYLACVITLWGMASLLTNTDPISETDAGPLLGPAMVLSAGIVTAIALWRLRRHRSLALSTLGAAASAYLVMLLVGTAGYTFTTGELAQLVLFPAHYALSAYVLGTGVLAAIAVVFLWAVTVRARRDSASANHLTGR